MPPNLQEVKLKFSRRRSAKVMGSLADREAEPQEGEAIKGIMVTNSDFQTKIVAPEDLATYTPLRVGSIASTLHVPFVGSNNTLELFFNEMFSGVVREDMYTDSDGASATRYFLHGRKVTIVFILPTVLLLLNQMVSSFFSF